MTESQARGWLSRGSTTQRCVSYRVDAEGVIAFAPRRAAMALAPWLALLVACAGHLGAGELDDPSACRDAAGYEIECPERRDEFLVRPDDVERAPARPPEDDPLRLRVAPIEITHALRDVPMVHRGVLLDVRPESSVERPLQVPVALTRTQGILRPPRVTPTNCLRPPGTDECWPAFLDAPTQAEAIEHAAARRTERRRAREDRVRRAARRTSLTERILP